MNEKRRKLKSDKKLGCKAVKRTLSKEERQEILRLERRLLKACEFHLRQRSDSVFNERRKESAKVLDELLSLFSKVDETFEKAHDVGLVSVRFNYKYIFQKDLKPLRKFITDTKVKINKHSSKPKKQGRPSLEGDLALLIYSVLTHFKGKRILIDEVGFLIRSDGPIATKLNKKYGNSTFSSLGFPSVRYDMDRWERSCKKALEKNARQFVFSTLYRWDGKEEDFLKEVKKGGTSYSEYLDSLEERD